MEQSETKEVIQVPYIAYESALYRADKKNRRLWITTILLILLMFGREICTEVLSLKQLNR